jgi:5-oxoprolinase (ATP-hydrolysing)
MVAQHVRADRRRLHAARAGQCRGVGAPRDLSALKDGEFALRLDNGRPDPGQAFGSTRATQRDDRFHRHERPVAEQFQRAAGDHHGRGPLCVSHAGGRRHPAECRLPEAPGDRRSRRLHAQPPAAGGGGGRQRRDLELRDQRAVRRARRDGGEPVHDEQLHLRQCQLPVLRDDRRRLGRGTVSTAPASSRRT